MLVALSSLQLEGYGARCGFADGLGGVDAGAADVFGRSAEVPDQAERLEEADQVVAGVQLPPEEALVRRAHVVVVVVVPPLPQGEEREHRVVAAGVGRRVAAPSPDVVQRVHYEGAVPEQDGGDEESPNQP